MIGSYVLSVHYIFYIIDRVLGENERAALRPCRRSQPDQIIAGNY